MSNSTDAYIHGEQKVLSIEKVKSLVEPFGFEHEDGYEFVPPLFIGCSINLEGCKSPQEVLYKIYQGGEYHGYNAGYEAAKDGEPHKYHYEDEGLQDAHSCDQNAVFTDDGPQGAGSYCSECGALVKSAEIDYE